MSFILYDRDIRDVFTYHHEKRYPTRKLLQEVRVNNGNAISDLISVGSNTHCFEIKGDTDKINRALIQSESYDLCFQRITLITTENQINKAMLLLPKYWGIISISYKNNSPVIKYSRKALVSPKYSKKNALTILWKNELLSISSHIDSTKSFNSQNREKLISIISEKYENNKIDRIIAETLINR